MEINIRLAGVQLGPYSEKQIREYIEEGLVSPADLACEDGTQDWIPVTDLLAKALPSDGEPPVAPPAMADAVFEDPEPMEPIRAPELPDGVTHLPIRAPDSGEPLEAMAKRTLMIGPTPPSRRPVPNKSPSASSVVTTTPLANQANTKKITRSSIVKGLAARTAPLPSRATIPINVPQRPSSTPEMLPSPPDAPAPATPPSSAPPIPDGTTMPPKKGGLPAILQSLTAKTAPMRSAPPAPPPRSNLPITTPLPTRPINQPIRAEPTPTELTESAAPAAEPTPVAEKPTEKLSPLPPTKASSEDLSDATKSKSLSRFSARKKTTPEEPKLVPVEEKPAPKPSGKPQILGLIIGCFLLAILFGYYVWSPYHAASNVHDALIAGTPSTLESVVDFDSVRNSLKDQFKDQTLTTSHDPAASASALDLLNKSVDLYVTPDGISGLASNSAQFSKDDLAGAISPDVASNLLKTFNSQPIRSSGLASLTDFVMKSDVAILHLQFAGLKWTLKRIELRPDLRAPASSTVASPLIGPVIDTYLARGADLARQADWNAAIGNFGRVLALDPGSASAYVARGGALESNGDLDGAIKDFTQAIALNPQMAEAFNGRGHVLAAKKDFDGAIADFSQAVKIDPTLATAYDSRGSAKTAKNQFDSAIADFSQAITIDPTLASAFANRGFARQANGNLDGAISDYTQAISLQKTAPAFYNRGLARQAHGDWDAAILDFGHAIAIDPKNAGAYYNRGLAKVALSDIDGAIADFTQALAINPENALALSNRGLARQSKNDLDGAVADYTQALSLDPKIAPAYYNRGLIRGQTNDPDGAIADASHSLDLDPKNNQAFYNRGYAKLLKGNLDGAQADFKQFCDVAPHIAYADNARLYLWLIAKAQPGRIDADQSLSDALENNWNSTADDLVTKTASYLLGRSSEAEYVASAAANDPKIDQGQHCQAFYFAGMHRLLIGDKLAAMDFFRKSVGTGQKDFCEYNLAQAELQGTAPPAPTPPVVAPPIKPVIP